MSTNAKLIIGYTDHMGYWNTTEEYVRWKDGYSEAVLPTLKKFTSAEKGLDIETLNNEMEHITWQFEKIKDEDRYSFGNMNYHYYIDQSNRAEIRCTVLKEDGKFYEKYGVMNMIVEAELVL